jgi:putative ABC transport system permease protein
VRVNSGEDETEAIKEVWSKFTSTGMFWRELGSQYAKNLKIEMDGFKSVLVFSILAIIISSLGLLGLAVFTVDQRIQEFGIRKVLGASVADIMQLFGLGFIKLVAIAFMLTIPISIYALQNWLNGFADRINLSAGIFIVTALITLLIVAATILFQSLKAGRLNPVDTLRNE